MTYKGQLTKKHLPSNKVVFKSTYDIPLVDVMGITQQNLSWVDS